MCVYRYIVAQRRLMPGKNVECSRIDGYTDRSGYTRNENGYENFKVVNFADKFSIA